MTHSPTAACMDVRSRALALALFGARIGCAAILSISLGCGEPPAVTTPKTDGSTLFWSLQLDQHALNLSTVSPYDTVRILATPLNSAGQAMTNEHAVTYVTGDPARVQVDSTGLVRAIGEGTAIPIVATLTDGNLTHTDTALVNIVGDSVPFLLQSFSIHPVPPDSTIWNANDLQTWFGPKMIIAHDAQGDTLPSSLAIYFWSSDTTIATIDRSSGALSGKRPGQVTVVSQTDAFGVAKADTIPFIITMPAFTTVYIAQPYAGAPTVIASPSPIEIAQGGTVAFFDFTLNQLTVTFDDSANGAEDELFCHCGAGNIPLWGGDTSADWYDLDQRGRSFPVAGTYTYHVAGLGSTTGSIIVDPRPASAGQVVSPTIGVNASRARFTPIAASPRRMHASTTTKGAP